MVQPFCQRMVLAACLLGGTPGFAFAWTAADTRPDTDSFRSPLTTPVTGTWTAGMSFSSPQDRYMSSALPAPAIGVSLVYCDPERSDDLSLSISTPISRPGDNDGMHAAPPRTAIQGEGNEFNFKLAYGIRVSKDMSWNAAMVARHDVDNVPNADAVDFLVGTKIRF